MFGEAQSAIRSPLRPQYRGRMSTPRVSSRAAVLSAALRIADSEGLDAVSMRRVAAELDLPVTTLYGFVRTKQEILDALGALALGDVGTGRNDDDAWSDQLAILIRDLRGALGRHPGAVEVILTNAASSGSFDHIREAILEVLHSAGFVGRDALNAMGSLVNYALGFAVAEGRRARFPELVADEPARLRRLHPNEYPRLYEVADDYLDHQADDAFETGLSHLLAGLGSQVATT